jgi:hypothetical protein
VKPVGVSVTVTGRGSFEEKPVLQQSPSGGLKQIYTSIKAASFLLLVENGGPSETFRQVVWYFQVRIFL